MTELLRTVDLTKAFSSSTLWNAPWAREEKHQALRAVSLSIQQGEVLGLVGESGSGKTTFARCVLRTIEPTSGQVFFHEREISHLGPREFRRLRSKMQMVFQSPAASLNPRMRVGNQILDSIQLHLGLRGRAARDRAVEIFRRVGLSPDDLDKYSHQLSGGQQQRVGVARAIAPNPELLILDEPTSALDASVKGQILNLLRDLQAELHMTYLFISHDLSTIHYLCDRAVVMYQGEIVESGEARELFERPGHPYTQMLIAAMPHLTATSGPKRLELSAAWDQGVAPAAMGACLFSPRCPIARPRCQEGPPLLLAGPTRLVRCWAAMDSAWGGSDFKVHRQGEGLATREKEERDDKPGTDHR